MKQRFLLLVSLICLSSLMNLWAVNAYPGWLTMDQPDGTTIEVRQMGDEYYHYWANRDGQEVEQNDDGWWVVKPVQLTSAQRRARRAASPKLQTAATTAVYTPARGLVILVNFKDVKMQSEHDSVFYYKMLNTNSGSVKKYFEASSDGKYSPDFDVWGPVTLDSAMAYYGANNSSGDDIRPGCMASEACKKAYERGCDFSKYATKKSSQVDNVHIIYAGYSEASGAGKNCIWPHKWNVYWANGECRELYEDPSIVGKQIYCYSCSAELLGKSGTTSASIGTFCHEFSHVLGLTDYYDTNGTVNGENDMTPASWALMDCGNYNNNCQSPALYSIFDKIYMGWATMPTLLKKNEQKNVIMPVGTAYSYYITGGTEAKAYTSTDTIYYLENRQKSGYFDKGLLYSGMLIWRVIYKSGWSTPNSTAGIVRYTLASATGLETGIGTNKDPFPGYNNVKYKKLFDGCELSSITLSNKVINFKYNGGEDKQLTHTWMANGSQFAVTNSYSTLTFPGSSPSSCNNRTFYGWTEQTEMEADGTGLVLTKNYSDISINKTFYAVYRTTAQPYRYSFYCTDFTHVMTDDTAMIVSTQYYKWHGKMVTAEGQLYDTIRTITGDSILRLNVSYVHARRAITYVASEKLNEVQEAEEAGLHIDVFGQPIQSHCFSSGSGAIVFENYVTEIGDNAFYGCSKMDSVVIPKSVTTIGDRAFSQCSNLKVMALGKSAVTSIGDAAFYKCQSMTAISLPPAITRIGDRALYYCKSLGSISIPANVTTIDKYAFGKCYALTLLSLPEKVATIGDSAFYNCNKLTKIKSYNTTPPACGTNSFIDVPNTIPVYVWTIAEEDYENDAKWQYFSDIRPFDCGDPATYDTVRAVVPAGSSYAFRDTVYTQSGIYMDTTMDKYGCDTTIYRLELVVLDSAKVIMYQAPQKLAETTDYSTPGNGLHTGSQSFGQAIAVHTFIDSVGYIAFRDTLRTIGESAFYGCREGYGGKMTAITLPKTITSLGTKALSNCRQLQSLILPEGLTSIGNEAFRKCYALTTITMEKYDALPTCSVAASFKDDSIKDITLYVWPIIYNAYTTDASWKKFNVQKLSCEHPAVVKPTYVTMCQGETYDFRGQQCTEPGEYHDYVVNKYGCDTTDYFLHLTVGNKYYFDTAAVFTPGQSYNWRGRSITESGFYYDSLHTIHGCDSVYAFYLADSTQAIIYKADAKLSDTIQIISGLRMGLHVNAFDQPIVAHTFKNDTGLLVFANSLTQVGDSAFFGCRTGGNGVLRSITFPPTVKSIGTLAFSNCRQLASVTFSDSLESIGESAFTKCYALENVSLPETMKSLGVSAFNNCTTVVSMTCKAIERPSCGDGCFTSVPTSAKLYVWPISYDDYDGYTPWSNFDVQKIDCDHHATHETTRDTICPGDSYEWFGKQYTKGGNYDTTTWNKYGCDTVFNHLELTMGEKQEYTEYHFLPTGQTYAWHGRDLDKDGIYYDSLTNRFGCDSVYKLYLMDSVKAIVYEADIQLPYGTGSEHKLHMDGFEQELLAHTYSDGKGVLLFADTLQHVGDSAFFYLNGSSAAKLTRVILPKFVTSIGMAAFYKCQYLTSLNLPSGITVISNRMLYDCRRLPSIIIPEGVTTIEEYGLSGCSKLKALALPMQVSNLAANALANDSSLIVLVSAATTPPTCANKNAFTKISKTILQVNPSSKTLYQNDDKWNYFTSIQDIDCGDELSPIVTQAAICQGETYTWRDKKYTAAGTYDDIIRNQYGCPTTIYQLQLTVNPKHLIEETATWVTGMTYPWHSRNLTTGGTYWDSLQTVAGCDSVYKLTLSFTDSTKAIIYTAPNKLRETPLIIPGKNPVGLGLRVNAFGQSITAHSFNGTVGVLAFDNDLTQVGDSAFFGCRDSIGCRINSIILPNTVTTFGEKVFYACWNMTSIQMPTEGITSMGQLIFHNCSIITDLTIPESVEVLHYRALNSCSSLQTLSLPESLDSLGAGVLRYDSNLVAITCKALTPPRCYGPSNTFSGITKKNVILYVWPSAIDDYKADNNWKDFNIQPITCENIPNVDTTYATICPSDSTEWRGKYYSAEGTYSDTLKNIYGCDSEIHRLILSHYPAYVIPEAATFVNGLTYVWHGKNLTEAGTYYDTLPSIHGCDSIIALTLTMTDSTKAIIYTAPAKLNETPIVVSGTRLGLRVNAFGQPIISHSFSNGIGVLAFANDLTQVGDTAFYGCRNTDGLRVNTITVPNTVTSIGEYAFYNCRNLTAVNIPSGVTSIGQAAFVRCEALPSIVLPEGITDLNYHTLYQCYALTSLTIPASVDSLGKEAIASCTGLTSLRVEAIHPPKCGKNCFLGITNTIPVSVWPIGFTEYQNSTPWQYFTVFQKIACDQPLSRDTTRATIGEGEVFEWLGKQYSKAGNYDSLTTNEFGCDTVMARLELTVTPFSPEEGSFFKETFSTLNPSSSWNNPQKDTIMRGDNGVYEWHVKRYQRGGDDNLIDGEAGTRYAANVNSYVETNGIQEGGVKYVLFNWRCPGTETYNITLQTDVTNSASQIVSRVVDEKGVQGGAQSCKFVGKYEVKENAKIKIKETAGTQSVIIGPVRIIPYLLYKNRNVSLTAADVATAGYKYKNTDIINNTGAQLDKGAITYTISGENNDKIAKLNAHTGELTIIGGGTVTVTAKWGKVTTSYNLTIAKLTPTISEFSNTTVDLFGTFAPAPVCKIGNEVISDAAYTYSSGNTDVVSVSGQNFTIHKPGTSVITATLTATDYYNSIAPTCTLTVTEPTDVTRCWKETFDSLEVKSDYNGKKEWSGRDGVLNWQARHFKYNGDKVNGENAIRLAYTTEENNFISYLGQEEGGIKSIYFNCRLPNTDKPTIKIIKRIRYTSYDKSDTTDLGTVQAGGSYYYPYVKKNINIKKNAMLTLSLPNDQASAVIFGPITIEPYLLYTQQKCTVQLSPRPFINESLINNTDQEGTVTYSLTDENTPKAATINATTGAVTMLNAGTVKVTATWSEGASTTYDLTIEKKSGSSRVETFNSSKTTDAYCTTVTTEKADLANWTYSLAGVSNNTTKFGSQNAVGIRAQNADDVAANRTSYIESSKIDGGLSRLSFLWNLNGAEGNTKWNIQFKVNGRIVKTLTSADITVTNTMDTAALVVIDNINQPGKFTLRIENLTTNKSDEIFGTGVSKGRFIMDNLEFLPYDQPLVLDEQDLNTEKITSYVGSDSIPIQLIRTLYNDRYNTFCVPFAVELDSMVRYFGSNYKLYEMTSGTSSNDGITINFDETANGITAGVPYLMEVAENVVNPTFTNRTITATTAGSVATTDEKVTFQGVYCQTMLHRNSSPLEYFLASNNVLYRPVVDENMKGLRCYFKINNQSGAPIRMNVNQPSTPTELEVHNAQCTMHNGKFIKDNQLIILREGKTYNAQGQLLNQ